MEGEIQGLDIHEYITLLTLLHSAFLEQTVAGTFGEEQSTGGILGNLTRSSAYFLLAFGLLKGTPYVSYAKFTQLPGF